MHSNQGVVEFPHFVSGKKILLITELAYLPIK